MSKMYNTPIVGDLYVFVVQEGCGGGGLRGVDIEL